MLPQDGSNVPTPNFSGGNAMSDGPGAGHHGGVFTDPLDMGNAFQHPFVPQDLWQMPMTLEWDWAGMTDYSGLQESGVLNVPANGAAGGSSGRGPGSKSS